MEKLEVKKRLNKSLIAVVRCKERGLALAMVETIIKGGIDTIEITYTVEGAGGLILDLEEKYPDAVIGAGTVLKLSEAEEAIENGAKFIVMPCIIPEVADFCKKMDIFFSMAAVTPSEIFNAYNMGCEVVKLFPGETFEPSIIKSLKAPFPFIEFMPTGGVNDKNVKEWFDAGAFAVGAGGYLTKGINKDNLNILEDRVRKLVKAAQ